MFKIEKGLNSGSAPVQFLSVVFQRFVMLRLFEEGPRRKYRPKTFVGQPFLKNNTSLSVGSSYSRMDQVKFVEGSV